MFNHNYHSRRQWQLFVLVALGLCAGTASKLPAAEPDVLFEDDFPELDASFASTDNCQIKVENNSLVATHQPSWTSRYFYQSGLFTDADISIRIRLGAPDAEKGAFAGIGFWARDYGEYYLFAISDSGTAAVYSTNGKRTIYPVGWRKVSTLKTDSEEWNELRVVTVRDWATLYLNGKKFAQFKGKPSAGGSVLGPVFSSGTEQASAQFSALKVVVPSGTDAIVPEEKSADPNILFSDDFAAFDPAWGTESGTMSVHDKKFLLKPTLEHGTHVFYGGVLVTDMDMTANVRVLNADSNSHCVAGLVFWAQGHDDFYSLQITSDGQASVARLVKDRWLVPLASKPVPTEAHFKADAPNELRVVTNGKKATCYVNGVSVGSVTGQPIKGDWQFGLYAQTGATQGTAEFSSLVVRKPAAAAAK